MEVHKRLYDTAVKLSVYSSFLDFGLAVSVVALQKNFLSFLPVAALINFFDMAITYLTFAIIILFSMSLAIKYKNKIVDINTLPRKHSSLEGVKTRRVTVSISRPPEWANQQTAKVPGTFIPRETKKEAFERFVNSKKETFLKINGTWYKTSKDSFKEVSRPDYE